MLSTQSIHHFTQMYSIISFYNNNAIISIYILIIIFFNYKYSNSILSFTEINTIKSQALIIQAQSIHHIL